MNTEAEIQEAIANCDRDPIHIPGTIQRFGALVVTDEKFTTIECVSANAQSVLGIEARDLLGAPVRALVGSETAHDIRNILSRDRIQEQREVVGTVDINDSRLQLSVHLKDGRAILEYLLFPDSDYGCPDALESARSLLADSVGKSNFPELLDAAVNSLRGSTGYDRVMAYRFLPDGSGEVIAESRALHAESFLGLRFPASDIPPTARKLYSTTPIRVLADVGAPDVPLLGLSASQRPVDQSLAILRSTPAVHTQYLKNMGVRSTMSLPIIVEGEMWGLFALHDSRPRIPDPSMLIAAELSGKMLSLVIEHATQIRKQAHLAKCSNVAVQLIRPANDEISVDARWAEVRKSLAEAIRSDGYAYIDDKKIDSQGSTPGADTCEAIKHLADSQYQISHYDNLRKQLPNHELGDVGGVLVLPITATVCVMIFRNLSAQKVSWAGAPEKKISRTTTGVLLNPRDSFDRYSEVVQGKCDEWTNDELEIASVLRDALATALEDEELKSSRNRLDLLVRELNHRVRNILTLVRSISVNSRNSANSLEEYAVSIEQRIIALAGAHELLTRDEISGADLKQLVALEMSPYLTENAVSITGPDVSLKPDVAQIVALVLHEMASNAAKYGALSVSEGTVTLSWSLSDGGVRVVWREQGGPKVIEPTQRGFGRSIIENAIPYEFDGEAQLRFVESGVEAEFTIPISEVVLLRSKDIHVTALADRSDGAFTHDKKPLCALVVEDNFVIASEHTRLLETLGFTDCKAVPNVVRALEAIETHHYDFCLLDVNLGGLTSQRVAEQLSKKKVPYIFATGYGSAGAAMCEQFDAMITTKPIKVDELAAALDRLLGARK